VPACWQSQGGTQERDKPVIWHVPSPPLPLSYLVKKHGAQTVRGGSQAKRRGTFLSCKRQWRRERICKSNTVSFISDCL